jgi:hypothetical protein
MRNEAAPEPARSVIRPCRPSVHPSRGGKERTRGNGRGDGHLCLRHGAHTSLNPSYETREKTALGHPYVEGPIEVI